MKPIQKIYQWCRYLKKVKKKSKKYCCLEISVFVRIYTLAMSSLSHRYHPSIQHAVFKYILLNVVTQRFFSSMLFVPKKKACRKLQDLFLKDWQSRKISSTVALGPCVSSVYQG